MTNHHAVTHAEDLVRDGQVHDRVYHDPEVFAQEMERIFQTAWVYVAHESEVAQPGDYRTTRLGTQEVVVIRGADDGVIRVLYNRCRHRGALVCQNRTGNSTFLRCPYHAWTYDSTGKLVGIPLPQRYAKELDRQELALTPVARVASYRGFIFASAANEGPSLEEHLGNARPYIDRISAHAAGVSLGAGAQRYQYEGNWKLQLENVVDNYHVTVVHKSFIDILAARTGSRGQWHSGSAKDLGNGHATLEFPSDTGAATGGEDFNLLVFPNLTFVGFQVRSVLPVRVDHTEVVVQPIMLNDVKPDVNEQRLRVHEESFGPAGFVSPDDVEVALHRVQTGTRSGDHWMELSRGLGMEEVLPGGVLQGHITDEVGQRGLYRAWTKHMDGVELMNGSRT
jgi:phenylpropionate dioxygenase-like ring-hydroxylating dioxygenase large terminal subunit